jgi:hypothetical protein
MLSFSTPSLTVGIDLRYIEVCAQRKRAGKTWLANLRVMQAQTLGCVDRRLTFNEEIAVLSVDVQPVPRYAWHIGPQRDAVRILSTAGTIAGAFCAWVLPLCGTVPYCVRQVEPGCS